VSVCLFVYARVCVKRKKTSFACVTASTAIVMPILDPKLTASDNQRAARFLLIKHHGNSRGRPERLECASTLAN